MAVPDKPQGIHRSVGRFSIAVFFTTNTTGAAVTGYRLLRGGSPGTYDTVVEDGLAGSGQFEQLSPTQYNRIDTPLSVGTYYYAVVAYNDDGDSEQSDEVFGTVEGLETEAAFLFWELDNGMLPELSLMAGRTYPSRLFWLNTGESIWTEDNFIRNAINPNGTTTWTRQRHILSAGDSVPPSGVGIFRAPITAPTTPGAYTFDWSFNQEALDGHIAEMPAYTIAVLPAAPESVTAEGGCGDIALSWSGSTGASAYRVYRRSPATDPWEQITSTSETSYTDGDIAPGQEYDYRVTAVAATGETPAYLCPIVTAASVLPGFVTGLAAMAGDGEVTLSWNAAGRASDYRISRGTSAGSLDATPLVDAVAGLTVTDRAVTNGVTYYYAVTATSDCGAGAMSAVVSATPRCCADAWTGAEGNATVWTAG
jgi:hypothetical protein